MQFGGDKVCWKVNWFVFKLKPRCITIFVVGNNPVFWPMHPNCRNWCPATTLGMFFWVWFDLWRLPRETVSKSCSLLKVMLLFYNKLVHSLLHPTHAKKSIFLCAENMSNKILPQGGDQFSGDPCSVFHIFVLWHLTDTKQIGKDWGNPHKEKNMLIWAFLKQRFNPRCFLPKMQNIFRIVGLDVLTMTMVRNYSEMVFWWNFYFDGEIWWK